MVAMVLCSCVRCMYIVNCINIVQHIQLCNALAVTQQIYIHAMHACKLTNECSIAILNVPINTNKSM